MAAVASTNITVSPRDNCGGFNGHVVWSTGSGAYIQLYGEVWDTRCPGSTSVWLAWDSPSYHNVQADSATEPNTEGVNYKTSISASPSDIKVTACSTYGGWHCGTPVDVPPPSKPAPTPSKPAPTTTTTTTSTPTPVVTVPVPVPVPEPAPRPRALRVALTISWTWNQANTQLHTVRLGSFPAATRLVVQCLGSGCPRPRVASASGRRQVQRLLRRLEGRLYRAGDRLMISLRASGWKPERAEIKIRSGQVPTVRLLTG